MGCTPIGHQVLVARGCSGAVIDSNWFPYSLPLVRDLAGPFVEVRCRIGVDVARKRYRRRVRDERHLDRLRTEDELWGEDVPPLGVGPVVEVNTAQPVDTAALADTIRGALNRHARGR